MFLLLSFNIWFVKKFKDFYVLNEGKAVVQRTSQLLNL